MRKEIPILSYPFFCSYRYRVVMKKSSLKFSIMITAVAPAAMLAGMWLTATYRGNDSRAMLLPDRVMTLFPDAKPLTAFALTDHQNCGIRTKWIADSGGSGSGNPEEADH
jgi:hypothetical protein